MIKVLQTGTGTPATLYTQSLRAGTWATCENKAQQFNLPKRWLMRLQNDPSLSKTNSLLMCQRTNGEIMKEQRSGEEIESREETGKISRQVGEEETSEALGFLNTP